MFPGMLFSEIKINITGVSVLCRFAPLCAALSHRNKSLKLIDLNKDLRQFRHLGKWVPQDFAERNIG